ncbi:thioesterase II family protein [Streptomyces rishiriensis]|uniref:thioesterase II family protein n=1 Tax=Streptomyces rishiriensis TaxID=68264 RepID=UPI0033D3D6D1
MRGSSGRVPLVCLPFAGSGAGFYRGWRKLNTDGIEVIPLQLPGREERFGEPFPTDVVAIAKELAMDAARTSADKAPMALLGHSLGAVVAYEMARELMRMGPDLVRHLFVSGSPGPWTRRTPRATGLDDEDFLDRVVEFAGYRHEAFDNPDLRSVLLPVLRADVAMHESYDPPAHELIDIPVTSLRGANDHLVTRSHVEEWRAVTTARFSVAELPGGHMYLVDEPLALLEIVRWSTTLQ